MKKIKYFLVFIILLNMPALFAQKVLTLAECKNLALKNNTKAKNSKLEMESSRQVRKSAFTKYFPNISAGVMLFKAQDGLMQQETQGGNLPVYDGNPANLLSATQFAYFPSMTTEMLKNGTFGFINIVQPIFAGGRIITGNKLASLGADVSEYMNSISENDVLLKTEEQYWLMVSLNEKMLTVQKYEELLNSLLKQVEDAYKSGIIMKNDLLKVKLKKSEVLLNKSKLENGRKIALMAFCQFIDVPFDSTLSFKDDLTITNLPRNYLVDHSEALKKLDEYQLLLKSVEAEDLKTSMTLGEYLPQVGVGLTGIYMKMDKTKGRTTGMVFGSVQIPLSDWWGGSHKLEERSIIEEIANNNFKNNSELLLLQMQKAWQDLEDSYKQVLICQESLEQAEENLKVNRDSYKNGIITVSDLLEAQAMHLHANDQLTDARADYKKKVSGYISVTGRNI